MSTQNIKNPSQEPITRAEFESFRSEMMAVITKLGKSIEQEKKKRHSNFKQWHIFQVTHNEEAGKDGILNWGYIECTQREMAKKIKKDLGQGNFVAVWHPEDVTASIIKGISQYRRVIIDDTSAQSQQIPVNTKDWVDLDDWRRKLPELQGLNDEAYSLSNPHQLVRSIPDDDLVQLFIFFDLSNKQVLALPAIFKNDSTVPKHEGGRPPLQEDDLTVRLHKAAEEYRKQGKNVDWRKVCEQEIGGDFKKASPKQKLVMIEKAKNNEKSYRNSKKKQGRKLKTG